MRLRILGLGYRAQDSGLRVLGFGFSLVILDIPFMVAY